MNQEVRRRIRIHVEGCLDAVLASLLIESVGLNRDQYYIQRPGGGWRGALRRLRDDLDNGFRAIAFIDADQGLEQALERVENVLTGFHIELSVAPAPHIAIKRDDRTISSVVLWAKPPDYQKGTVEDLVCGLIGENLCLEMQQNLKRVAERMGEASTNIDRWLRKLTPLIILSIGAEQGTLVYVPEYERCGIDLSSQLRKYLDHEYVKPYKAVLKKILQIFHLVKT